MPGGTGTPINLNLFNKLNRITNIPLILAGGIKPDNVSDIVSQSKPHAIDILTGVENAPGYKSEEKIAALMKKMVS